MTGGAADAAVLTHDEIAALCTAGSTAPSGANDQPWLVTVAGRRLAVTLDPRRAASTMLDVGGYGSLFGVGCFAENVRIAALSRGLEHDMVVGDDGVAFTFTGRRDPHAHELYPYLPERMTNRGRHRGAPLADVDVRRLSDVVADVDPGLAVVALANDDRKRAAGRALGTADAVRMRHPALFADMMAELTFSASQARSRSDGLDIRSLALPASTRGLLRVLRRIPPLRRLLPAAAAGSLAQTLARHSSHLCCLSTSSTVTGRTILRGGMAMQRLWLTATASGIAVHPWTVSTFLAMRAEVFGGAGLRTADTHLLQRVGRDLRATFGLPATDTPVFVFRLLTAPRPSLRAARRPWQSFTTIQASPPAATDDTKDVP